MVMLLATFDPVGLPITPFNLTGHPAISIPIGFDDQGLPVGLQAVARWGQEQLLFDLASVLQERFSWAEHWPSAVGFQTSSEIALSPRTCRYGASGKPCPNPGCTYTG